MIIKLLSQFHVCLQLTVFSVIVKTDGSFAALVTARRSGGRQDLETYQSRNSCSCWDMIKSRGLFCNITVAVFSHSCVTLIVRQTWFVHYICELLTLLITHFLQYPIATKRIPSSYSNSSRNPIYQSLWHNLTALPPTPTFLLLKGGQEDGLALAWKKVANPLKLPGRNSYSRI